MRNRRECPSKGVFSVDRSVVTSGKLDAESDEKAFWLSKTPLERLEAVEFMRGIAYGCDSSAARLQRLLEVAEGGAR